MEKRLIPVNIFDTVTMEQWLAQMADEGLILNSFSGKKAVFEDQYCQKMKFSLIPADGKGEEISSQMKELFKEAGWTYVDTLQEVFHVFSNQDEYPKPVPFAREEEQRIYTKLKKEKRNSMFISVGASVFLLGFQMFLAYLRLEDYILGMEDYNSYIYVIMFIINTMGAVREYRSYTLLKRKLEGMEHGEEECSLYIPTTKWIRTEIILNISIFAIMLCPIIAQIKHDNELAEVAKIDVPFTYVSLEEIEMEDPGVQYRSESTYVDKRASLFAPTQYEINQYGKTTYVSNEKWQGYEAKMKLVYIELRYKVLADQIIHSMIRHYDATQVEKEGLDQVWIAKATSSTSIFLLKDNKILKIVYWGDADVLSHFNDFSDIVQQTQIAKSI